MDNINDEDREQSRPSFSQSGEKNTTIGEANSVTINNWIGGIK